MTTIEWFKKAKAENFAIGAFNIDNLEIFKAVIAAARNKKSPVIVEFSDGEAKYFGLPNIVDLVQNAREETGLPILLNLDHGPDQQSVEEAIKAGFDMVHFDGSKMPYEENLRITKEIVPKAHEKGLTVEAEIDHIAGASTVHREQITIEQIRQGFTDPVRAKGFVQEAGVDIYAAFFGNVHGVFPVQPKIDLDLLKRIREAIPETFLSLHGGSGISDEEICQAISVGGIAKININTELREAFRKSLEKILQEKPEEYTVYKLMPEVIASIQSVVEHKIETFGSAGKV